jgi:NitT/TauT family transport system substrate-binding protein
LVATISAAAIIAGACSSAATPVPTKAPTAGPAATGTAAPSPTKRVGPPAGQASSFIFSETGFGMSGIPAHAAIDVLNQQGYKITISEIAEAEVVTEGVASNKFQFGYGANNSALLAMEKGAKIKFAIDLVSNVWGIVALATIKTCDQLIANRVAIHSPGSVSTAMLKDWIAKKCPANSTFQPIVIAGSQNRAAALLAGQIDATPAELADWLNIKAKDATKYIQLADFAKDLPGLHPTSIYGNTAWMEQNPAVVTDLVREIVLQNRRVASEPGYLLTLYKKFLPEEVKTKGEAAAKEITDAYTQKGLFDVNGGIDAAAIEYTAKFFGPSGTKELKADMPVSQIAELSYLNAVLTELGKK